MTTWVAGPTRSPARAPEPLDADRPVAWVAVLALAVAMAAADVFWLVSLRQITGAVERTSDPATQWVREGLLLLPAYVVAVLLARRALLRRGRARPGGGLPVVGGGATIALAGALVGVVALLASSAYDFVLQSELVTHLAQHGRCAPSCPPSQSWASFTLLLQSAGWGSLLMLVSNVVAVGWLAALWGGRLRLVSGRATPSSPPVAHRLLALTLLGPAVIHLAVTPEHVQEWWAAAAFFVVLALAEVAVAVALLWRPGPGLVRQAAALCALPLAVWLLSRTVGLPFGPERWTPEAVGLADVASGLIELGGLLLAVVLVARPVRLSRDALRTVMIAVVAVTAIGLGGSGIAQLDVTVGSSHAEAGTN